MVFYSKVPKPSKRELNLDEQSQLREDLYSECSSTRDSSLAVLGLLDNNILPQRISVVIDESRAMTLQDQSGDDQRGQPHKINRNSPPRSVATESQQSHSVEKTAEDGASTGQSSSHKTKSQAGISNSTKSYTSDSEVDDEDEDEDEDETDGSDSYHTLEDEGLQMYERFLDNDLHNNFENEPDSARRFLEPVKKRIIDWVMTEFWAIFNQEWFPSSPVSTHATLPIADQKSGMSYNYKPNETSQGSIKNDKKGRLLDDDQDEPVDENVRNPKHTKIDVALPAFACPFRKHDPFKYSTVNRKWHRCAITPYRSITRVKEHLTRAHRIWQCPRCKNTFQLKTLIDSHMLAEPACAVIYLGPDDIKQPLEGITEAFAEWLRRKGKAYRQETGQSYNQQSKEDRWRTIYKKFFPNEQVPSPYFDEPRIEESQTPNSSVLAIYDDFRRRDVPRMVRSVLETEVKAEVDPISRATADRLYGRLIMIMQDAQEQAYNQFHKQNGGSSYQTAENMSLLPPLALPIPESPGEEDCAESVNDQEIVMSSLTSSREPNAIDA